MKLTLFDLDNTLLAGDTDVLWCDYLMDRGILDRAQFSARNEAMDEGYRAGTVPVADFANFYAETLAGRTRAHWEPVRQAFLVNVILPRIPDGARELVRRHLRDGDLVVLTTATNRYLTELTAQALEVQHLIATELEEAAGTFTGRTTGTLNMREGKVTRLHEWLAGRGIRFDECDSTAYSDSINDLPLLAAARQPVVVNPDAKLAKVAVERRWPVLRLH
ncbi:HAD family hydrolase [Ramlibacter albus]|uniref:HAD-IB family hydrolase n=1 Tax=Ramlibacter albus TaxID=2079448 RepID=A0A923MEM7_9BURK|nr:HAD-IB family hydrolase [Ramlibacter albus]MBC5768176.1 HAD-IB family hydrolase [Ramlibacter albus]